MLTACFGVGFSTCLAVAIPKGSKLLGLLKGIFLVLNFAKGKYPSVSLSVFLNVSKRVGKPYQITFN